LIQSLICLYPIPHCHTNILYIPPFNSVANKKKVMGGKNIAQHLPPPTTLTPVPSMFSTEVCISLTLVAAGFSKTLLLFDQSTWCRIQPHHNLNIEHYMSLKSLTISYAVSFEVLTVVLLNNKAGAHPEYLLRGLTEGLYGVEFMFDLKSCVAVTLHSSQLHVYTCKYNLHVP